MPYSVAVPLVEMLVLLEANCPSLRRRLEVQNTTYTESTMINPSK